MRREMLARSSAPSRRVAGPPSSLPDIERDTGGLPHRPTSLAVSLWYSMLPSGMENPTRTSARKKMHQTTVRFGDDLWRALELEAESLGVSVAQYVRDAALSRLSYDAGRDNPFVPALVNEGPAKLSEVR